MKRRIRLTESDLNRIVNRSVKRVLRESSNSMITRAFQKSGYPYHHKDDEFQSRKNRQHSLFGQELDNRYKNQFYDEDGFFNDMSENEIRQTEAYKIAYETIEDYSIEGEWDENGIDERETVSDVAEYTRIPDRVIWVALDDWKNDNGF